MATKKNAKRKSEGCSVCREEGRLTRCEPGGHGNPDGKDDLLLCDECYEARTGFVAVCQDFCSLPLDHDGLCHG